MIISKVSSEGFAPDWFGVESYKGAETSALDQVDVDANIDVCDVIASQVSDEHIVTERSRMEKCASNDTPYYYNNTWNKEHIAMLKEYTHVCGLEGDKFVGVDPSTVVKIEAETKEPQLKVAASDTVVVTAEESEKPFGGLVLNDPFHLDEIAEERQTSPKREDWEKIEAASKLNEKPSMKTSAIRSLGGGEDYNINSNVDVGAAQNSIMDPDRIKNLVDSDSKTGGEKIAEQAKAKEQERVAKHESWESDKIKEVVSSKPLVGGTIFPTESMVAQPGLVSDKSIYSDSFDKDSVPEKTAGEKIAENNEAHKRSIQRETAEKDDFIPSRESYRSISEDFASSLQAAMGK